jgi:hypothetical protein
MLDWSEPVESADVPLVPDDDATDAVVWLVADDVAPNGPSTAITPNASTNVASDAAITRLRIRPMRAARARSLACASSFGDRVGSELGRSARGRSEGGGSDMDSTVGARSESTLGAAWEIPELPCRPRAHAPSGAADLRRHRADAPPPPARTSRGPCRRSATTRADAARPVPTLRHYPRGRSAAAGTDAPPRPARTLRRCRPRTLRGTHADSQPPPRVDSARSQAARRPCLLASRACRPSRREGVP